MIEVPIIRSRI